MGRLRVVVCGLIEGGCWLVAGAGWRGDRLWMTCWRSSEGLSPGSREHTGSYGDPVRVSLEHLHCTVCDARGQLRLAGGCGAGVRPGGGGGVELVRWGLSVVVLCCRLVRGVPGFGGRGGAYDWHGYLSGGGRGGGLPSGCLGKGRGCRGGGGALFKVLMPWPFAPFGTLGGEQKEM